MAMYDNSVTLLFEVLLLSGYIYIYIHTHPYIRVYIKRGSYISNLNHRHHTRTCIYKQEWAEGQFFWLSHLQNSCRHHIWGDTVAYSSFCGMAYYQTLKSITEIGRQWVWGMVIGKRIGNWNEHWVTSKEFLPRGQRLAAHTHGTGNIPNAKRIPCIANIAHDQFQHCS